MKVSKPFFSRNPVETQVVLASLTDASDLLRLLLNGGRSAKAGYLAGAFRQTGRPALADEIVSTMKSAGYDVRQRDLFAPDEVFEARRLAVPPIVGRVEMMWESMREAVIETCPPAPGLPQDRAAYLRAVDEIYQSDAYHSLSIEGCSVTPAVIERVRTGDWDPEHHDDDRKSRDALAARGYWQAFQFVKRAVEEVLAGANPGARAHRPQRVVRRTVPALCRRGPDRGGRARRLPEQCGVSAHLALCSVAVGGGARRHAGIF